MAYLPRPWIDRPMIRAIEVGDTPQIKLPSSKTARAAKKDAFTLKDPYIRPYNGWKADAVRRYADPYHPMSSVLLKAAVIAGMAVVTIVRSRAMMNTDRHTPSMMRASGRA